MANEVTMQFVSSTGTYTFDLEAMPLFGRRVEYNRQSDQGQAGNKKINCSLNGFFANNSHKEVIAEYQKLLAVVKSNDARFIYKTDALTTVVDQRVYIDDYVEPADWKQYSGDYSLAFHYFELPNHTLSDLSIIAVYRPTSGPPYTFNPVPHWAGSFKPNRVDFRSPRFTPSGAAVSSETTITLTGRLSATQNSELAQKVDIITQAFKYDGVLDYGAWSNAVRLEDFQIPSTFPRDYCDYQIILKYDSPGIIHFSSKRSIGRLHGSPKITELPYCGQVRTQVFDVLGQTINYHFSLRALSVQAARDLLVNEVQNMVLPGGIELEGGREDWDYTGTEVSLSFSKYHFPAVIGNLLGT